LIPRAADTPVAPIGPVAVPLSEPAPQLSEFEPVSDPARGYAAGIWECTPGRYRRTVMQAEFCHFITGACRFEPDHGEAFEIVAGDAVFFPANTHGVWTIHVPTRKSYLVFTP
jgi:uncharacterized cupin superfamily protein